MNELAQKVKALPLDKRLCYYVVLCRRAFPIYQSFVDKYRFGNLEVLGNILDCVRMSLEGKSHAKEELEQFRVALQIATPDAEDFNSLLAMFARNVSVAFSCLLDLIDTYNTDIELAEDYLLESYFEILEYYVEDNLEEGRWDDHDGLAVEHNFYKTDIRSLIEICNLIETADASLVDIIIFEKEYEPIFNDPLIE